MHAARFGAVLAAVEAILLAQRLSLTAIGRSYRSCADARHGVKRIDRLLGIVKLGRELPLLHGAIARAVIGYEKRVVVAVDWTQLVGGMWSIDAAVAFSGRAV